MKHLKKLAFVDYSSLVGKKLRQDLDMGPIDETKPISTERDYVIDGTNLMELSNDEAILVAAKAGLMHGEDFEIPAGAEVVKASTTPNGNLEATFKVNGHTVECAEIAFDSDEKLEDFFI